ncbi:NotI family restriction endonuclease [Candidatus Protochlamydia phocaeensis]|uniref:NotI family restriction endonuclease n=1 Tax=Candidatus Protochlamydia phocaeensis TaxID=1414722 RepID=UPI000838FEE2|nr:NotI family restriction endonuclease [Candidatus Protochlamydia phocaeensis]
MTNQPLAEIFGYPAESTSPEAQRCRKMRLCPFNNRIPNCTKDRAKKPLGVCSIYEKGRKTVVCPIRLRQNWRVIEGAADAFFDPGTLWTSITDVKLFDKYYNLVGIIDFILVAYNQRGDIIDFGALDLHAAYVTQNLRRPFERYMYDQQAYLKEGYKGQNQPHADYLSTIRKRIAPQLIYKGSIFHAWQKRSAIALDKGLFDALPGFTEVDAHQSEVTWLVYDYASNNVDGINDLILHKTVHTLFEPTLFQITRVEPGLLESFISELQEQLDEQLDKDYPPDVPILEDLKEE